MKTCDVCYSPMEERPLFTSTYWHCVYCEKRTGWAKELDKQNTDFDGGYAYPVSYPDDTVDKLQTGSGIVNVKSTAEIRMLVWTRDKGWA